ncbi:MAG: hypothetical protein ACOX4F_08125 [Atopobiaceae bacterium]
MEFVNKVPGISVYEGMVAYIAIPRSELLGKDLSVSILQDSKRVDLDVSWTYDNEVASARLDFVKEGNYEDLAVSYEGTSGAVEEHFCTGEDHFVIDASAPHIELLAETQTGVVNLFSQSPTEEEPLYLVSRQATLVVEDQTFAEDLVEMGTSGPVSWQQDQENPRRYQAKITLPEGSVDAAIRVRDALGRQAEGKTGSHIVVDSTAPAIERVRCMNTSQRELGDAEIYLKQGEQRIAFSVRDEHLEGVELTCDGRVLPLQHQGTDWIVELEEGTYQRMVLTARDKAGHISTREIKNIVVDITAPQVKLDFSSKDAAQEIFKDRRFMSVTVEEAHWDAKSVSVRVVHKRGDALSTTLPNAWQHQGDIHTLSYEFSQDGTYFVEIHAQDALKNEAQPVISRTFVVDATTPEVSIFRPDPSIRIGQVDYYGRPVSCVISIFDANLDLERTTVQADHLPDLSDIATWEHVQASDGTPGYTTTIQVDECPDGIWAEPTIDAFDVVGHSTHAGGKNFVVDREAPRVVHAELIGEPSAQLAGGSYIFFNTPAKLALSCTDTSGVTSMSFKREETLNTYELEKPSLSQVMTLDLAQDFLGSRISQEDEVIIQDVVGNTRVWSLGSMGSVQSDKARLGQEDLTNTALARIGHPAAVILDTNPADISLGGPTSHSYYRKPQTLNVSVDEDNFSLLAVLDPTRPVALITKRDAATQEETQQVVCVSDFIKQGMPWVYQTSLAEDGIYSVTAQLTDCANNRSNTAELQEVTIDTSAPQASLTWSEEPASHGRYYAHARTAYLSIQETSFDPDLVSIDTDGQLRSWNTSGLTHTIEIIFAQEGEHHLTVSGKDLAGNAFEPLTEEPFIIDTTPPELVLAGEAEIVLTTGEHTLHTLEDEGAYNGQVTPRVELSDAIALDAETLKVELTRVSHPGELPHITLNRSLGEKNISVEIQNLGMSVRDAHAFDPLADDIYDLRVYVEDCAGNAAEKSLRFSLNRFGSTYLVRAYSADSEVSLGGKKLLWDAPDIEIREINVSGVDLSTLEVTKEYAQRTVRLEQSPTTSDAGYTVVDEGDATQAHWHQTLYHISRANFGIGSSSDDGDGGQGSYAVFVSAYDRAHNLNSSTQFWKKDEGSYESDHNECDLSFTLDEIGPAIEPLNIAPISCAFVQEVEIYIKDEISNGDDVSAYVDNAPVEVVPTNRAGTYRVRIPAQSFAPRKLKVEVTDYAGRSASAESEIFYISSFIPEAVVVAAAIGLVLFAASRYKNRTARFQEAK